VEVKRAVAAIVVQATVFYKSHNVRFCGVVTFPSKITDAYFTQNTMNNGLHTNSN